MIRSIFLLVLTFILIKMFFPDLSASVEHVLELGLHALESLLGKFPA